MIYDIRFKTKEFNNEKDYNELTDLTSNTIIICKSIEVKKTITDKIIDVIDFYDEEKICCDYNTSYKVEMLYRYTTILDIKSEGCEVFGKYHELNNKQKIIIATETPFVLQCDTYNDLWFACNDKEGKINVYPFTDFENYKKEWKKGKYNVYKMVTNGVYWL